MRRYWFVSFFLVALVAAACSGDSEDSAPPADPTEIATAQPTEVEEVPTEVAEPTAPQPAEVAEVAEVAETPTPEPAEAADPLSSDVAGGGEDGGAGGEPAEAADPLSSDHRDLADALHSAMLEVNESHAGFSNDGVRCLADGLAGVFSDDRLAELGLNGASVTEEFEGLGAFRLGEVYEISDGEASEMVDRALGCVDWRVFLAEAISAEDLSTEQANCIASEITEEGIRAVVMDALIEPAGEFFGVDGAEALEATRVCVDAREMFFETFVRGGLSEKSARCVVDGLPDDFIEMMFEGQESDLSDEEAIDLMGELLELQTRCLTPEELDLSGPPLKGGALGW